MAGYFTEKTARRAVESLKYCGWSGDWDTWDGLGSQPCELDVQEDRDIKSGDVRGTRVAWVNPAHRPMKNAMDQSARRQLAARMRGLVTEVLASPTQGQAPRQPARQPPPARRGGQGAPPPVDDHEDYADYADRDGSIPF